MQDPVRVLLQAAMKQERPINPEAALDRAVERLGKDVIAMRRDETRFFGKR